MPVESTAHIEFASEDLGVCIWLRTP